MKRYKLTLTENQINVLMMAIQEAQDGNSYQDDSELKGSYGAVLRELDKFNSSVNKQLTKQGWWTK